MLMINGGSDDVNDVWVLPSILTNLELPKNPVVTMIIKKKRFYSVSSVWDPSPVCHYRRILLCSLSSRVVDSLS